MDPQQYVPYLTLVCLARSSALLMAPSILAAVRKAAKLAVYEEIMMRVKNHHIPATMRVEMALAAERSRRDRKTFPSSPGVGYKCTQATLLPT